MQFCLSGVGALNSASDLYGALRERYSSFISPFCVFFRFVFSFVLSGLLIATSGRFFSCISWMRDNHSYQHGYICCVYTPTACSLICFFSRFNLFPPLYDSCVFQALGCFIIRRVGLGLGESNGYQVVCLSFSMELGVGVLSVI